MSLPGVVEAYEAVRHGEPVQKLNGLVVMNSTRGPLWSPAFAPEKRREDGARKYVDSWRIADQRSVVSRLRARKKARRRGTEVCWLMENCRSGSVVCHLCARRKAGRWGTGL